MAKPKYGSRAGNDRMVSLLMASEEWEQVVEAAKREKTTASEIMRRFIRIGLQQQTAA